MKIHKLDSSVYNKIAAGEVVERPASVVKELVENAIDAGAKNIDVSVKNGGLDEITVTDNGSGIEKEDIKTAFLPHATSKIRIAEDLEKIDTLGFRGEALPSIASISMISIKSKTKGAETGTRLFLRGGEIEEEGTVSMNVGTEISVRHLFFNTPARLKFLKTPSGELSEIKSVCQKLILANPDICISLFDEKGKIYVSRGEGPLECLRALFSDELVQNLLPVSYEKEGVSVRGFTSRSTYFKTNRTYQIAVINGRVAENQSISSAITTVYSQFLMKRNYPVVLLDISVPSKEIDVNVHPTKAEVRFSDNNKIFSAVYHALKNAVEEDIANRKMQFTTINDEIESFDSLSDLTVKNEMDAFPSKEEVAPHAAKDEIVAYSAKEEEDSSSETLHDFESFSEMPSYSENVLRDGGAIGSAIFANYQKLMKKKEEQREQTKIAEADSYRIIGQVFGTYLLIEYDEKFIIVDQHAAVERLRFDHLLEAYEKGQIVSQPLLFPMTIEVSPSEYEIVSGKIESLKEIGIEIIPFGDATFKLLSVPHILSDLDLSVLIREILSDKPDKRFPLVRDKLAYAACRSSIKGNTYLSNEEIEGLMNAYFKKGLPLQCPHGRPAYFVYTKKDLEKLFKRIV